MVMGLPREVSTAAVVSGALGTVTVSTLRANRGPQDSGFRV